MSRKIQVKSGLDFTTPTRFAHFCFSSWHPLIIIFIITLQRMSRKLQVITALAFTTPTRFAHFRVGHSDRIGQRSSQVLQIAIGLDIDVRKCCK